MPILRLIRTQNVEPERTDVSVKHESELIDKFIDASCLRYKANYRSKYGSIFNHYVPWLREHGLLAWEIRPEQFDDFSKHLQNNISKSTVKRYLYVISSFYEWLISRYGYDIEKKYKIKIINPVDVWNTPKVKKEEYTLPALPDEEVVHFFLQSLKNEFKKAMDIGNNRECVLYARRIVSTSIMLKAGLRVSEVSKLNVSDILLKEMLIIVHSGKGDKDRIVDLNGELAVLLKWYMEEAHPYVLYKKKIEKNTPLIISEQGKRMSVVSLQSELRKLQIYLNIPIDQFFSPHGLRRLFATNLYKALLEERHNDPITYVKIQLGHVFYSTTLRYCRIETAITSRSNNMAIDAVKRKLLGGDMLDDNMEPNSCNV